MEKKLDFYIDFICSKLLDPSFDTEDNNSQNIITISNVGKTQVR